MSDWSEFHLEWLALVRRGKDCLGSLQKWVALVRIPSKVDFSWSELLQGFEQFEGIGKNSTELGKNGFNSFGSRRIGQNSRQIWTEFLQEQAGWSEFLWKLVELFRIRLTVVEIDGNSFWNTWNWLQFLLEWAEKAINSLEVV